MELGSQNSSTAFPSRLVFDIIQFSVLLVGQVFTSGIYYIYIFNEMIEKSFKMARVFEFLCVLSCRGTSNITATPEMNSLFFETMYAYVHTLHIYSRSEIYR